MQNDNVFHVVEQHCLAFKLLKIHSPHPTRAQIVA